MADFSQEEIDELLPDTETREPDLDQSMKQMSTQVIWRNRLAIVIISLGLGFQTFPNIAISYFFKDDLGLNVTQQSFYNSLLNFIWVLKPVFGFISDSYPIFKSHRTSYLVIFSILNGLGWLCMGAWVSNLWQAMLIKTLINVSTSFQNVIGEGIMVESGQGNKQLTATNLSIYLSLTSASSILSSYLGGKLLTIYTNQQIFLLSISLPLLILIAGFIQVEQQREELQPGICRRARMNLVFAKRHLAKKVIWKPTVFIFFVVLAPGTTVPMFYYESNILQYQPNNFGVLSMISSVSTIVGIWIYRSSFDFFGLRIWFVLTTFGVAIFQLLNLIVMEYGEHNVWIAYFQQFGYALANEMHLMPLMMIAAQMCPKGIEATFYALVLAVINAGYLISYWLGGLLAYEFEISGEEGSFGKMPILIGIAALVPIVTLLMMLILPRETFKQKLKPQHSSEDSDNGTAQIDQVLVDSTTNSTQNVNKSSYVDVGEKQMLIDSNCMT